MFEFLATWFAFGSVVFWLVLFAELIFLLVFLANGHKWWAAFTVLGTAFLLGSTHVKDLFNLVVDHPITTVLCIVLYFMIGTTWSIFKWFKFLVKYRDEKLEYDYQYQFTEERIPKAKDSKSKITSWIIFWPFSVLGYLVWDLIRDIANRIYKLLVSLYDSITHHVFKDVKSNEPNASIHHIHND